MIVEYRSSFVRDIKKIKQKATRNLVKKVMDDCEKAKTIGDIPHCEPLQSRGKILQNKTRAISLWCLH